MGVDVPRLDGARGRGDDAQRAGGLTSGIEPGGRILGRPALGGDRATAVLRLGRPVLNVMTAHGGTLIGRQELGVQAVHEGVAQGEGREDPHQRAHDEHEPEDADGQARAQAVAPGGRGPRAVVTGS